MGLDTSHDCWHGAYSAFTRWRNKIAEVAGYQLRRVKYDGGFEHDTPMMDYGRIERDNPNVYAGEWQGEPLDVLEVLLAHSDCEGVIPHRFCLPLAHRLEALLPKLSGDGGGHIGEYRAKTQAFIDGLRRAAAAGEDVDFH